MGLFRGLYSTVQETSPSPSPSAERAAAVAPAAGGVSRPGGHPTLRLSIAAIPPCSIDSRCLAVLPRRNQGQVTRLSAALTFHSHSRLKSVVSYSAEVHALSSLTAQSVTDAQRDIRLCHHSHCLTQSAANRVTEIHTSRPITQKQKY